MCAPEVDLMEASREIDFRDVHRHISHQKKQVAKTCVSYGIRVQKSVFEMQLGQKEWVELRARLLAEIDLERDSLRVYFIDQSSRDRIEHFGVMRPFNVVEDTLAL
jgi:CRISPR-associated protein Cas2